MSFGLDRYLKKKKKRKKEQVEEEQHEEKLVKQSLEDHIDAKHDWRAILEETVRAMILFPHNLDYTRMNILPQRPSITAEELKVQLHVPLGVAIVVLDQLHKEQKQSD